MYAVKGSTDILLAAWTNFFSIDTCLETCTTQLDMFIMGGDAAL